MAYVSVGRVENLEEALADLQGLCDSMESAARQCLDAAKNKELEAGLEAANSARMLEEATLEEAEASRRLEQARQDVSAAQARLESANSALDHCEAGGSYDEGDEDDEGGHYTPPDCGLEEDEVFAAEQEAQEADAAEVEADQAFEAAKEQRRQLDLRAELSRDCLARAANLAEMVHGVCAVRLACAANLLSSGQARLRRAQEALNAYLATNHEAAKFYAYLNWSPPPNKVVTPKDLAERLNMSPEQRRLFLEYLIERDPAFRGHIAEYRRQLGAAKGPAEKLAVQLKIRRHLSGYCGEKLVEQALKPLGATVTTQARTVFEDGRFTKTDLVIENLKAPVILGQGKGMGAPAGGSIAIEVKCGQASYLYAQKDHMVFQAGGHRKADASMTVCSRDIKDLTPEQEEELREALRKAGSPLIGMLPKKEDLDQACWQAVNGYAADNGETHEG